MLTKKIRIGLRGVFIALLALVSFAPTVSAGVVERQFDPTVLLTLKGGLKVRNQSGGTIAQNAFVYVSGWDETNQRWLITKADADAGANTRAQLVLLGTGGILNNSNGDASAVGTLSGTTALNVATNGSTIGDPVYLSTTAGAFTLTAPSAANAITQIVGRVRKVSATVGIIEVNLRMFGVDKWGSQQLQAGSVSGALSTTLKTGTIPLSLATARIITTNDYVNTAGTGGILTLDSAPKIQRVNGATDPGARITWAAAGVQEIQWDLDSPADIDTASPVVVNLVASMSGATDSPVIAVKFFEGVSGSNLGGNTAAVSGATPTAKSVNVTSVATSTPGKWVVSLTPAAHGTDTLRLDNIYLSYTKK